MINFRTALLPSLILGLMLAITPAQQADAKENTSPAKVSKSDKKVADNKKAVKTKTAKKTDKDQKTTSKKVAKNKKAEAKVANTSKLSKAEKRKLAKQAREKDVVKVVNSKTAKTKEQRLAERKERTRERLAQVSRTGQKAKVAKYTAKPVVIAAAATASAAALASQNSIKESITQQSEQITKALNVESKAALVMNAATGEVLYAKNTNQSMPIASITKLMTVMVVLDAKLPLDEPIAITEEDIDRLKNTSSRLSVGTVLSRAELMLLALMSSENRAAHALARTYTGGTQAAIAAMNRKASSLGMTQSRFEDGTGLSSSNVASPKDLVAMVKAANNYPLIRRFSTTGGHALAVKSSVQQFNNTNALVKNPDWEIGVSKTGFINEAGKCLVMQAKINSTPVVIVLMDSWGKYTRIGDAQRVKKWLEASTN